MTDAMSSGTDDFSVTSTDQLDRLNLEQALIDFEIANARVVDLTGRVTSMSSQLLQLRSELGLTKLQASQLQAEAITLKNELLEIRRSLAFRALRGIGDLRAMARRR